MDQSIDTGAQYQHFQNATNVWTKKRGARNRRAIKKDGLYRLKKTIQQKIFRHLLKNNIENFIGVPDSTLKFFIDEGIKMNKTIIANREDEAIGIAAGMSLSNSNSLVFMQNAGFANSLSTITSLIDLYEIPLIFVIGWRGFLKNDAPEHEKIGKIQPELLASIKLKNRVIDETNWKQNCNWALNNIKKNTSVALIVRRDTLG